MEHASKMGIETSYLARTQGAIGSYESFDVVETRRLGDNSEILYVSINFERGAVFARFQMYRGDGDWVVQNMDFSTQPEELMPWLAFNGGNYSQ
jgi:hypothetical protein